MLTSSFYQPANILDILLQSSINTMIAVGMTLVIMTRGIDLSVGSMVGLTSMITASLLPHNLFLGIAAGMLMGVICGLINGLMIAKLKLPDFIVTLGMLSIYRGAALIYTDGRPIYGIDERFRSIFAGELVGIPTPVLLAVAIAVAAYLLVRYTALGEQIIAVGGNEEAARLSGINTDRVKICVYVISGLLSSIAGFVLIGRVGAAEPIGGNGFELQAIGAAVIGGASLFGGEGNPLGSLIGALTLGAMQNGLTLNECARRSGNSWRPAQSSSWPSLSTRPPGNANDAMTSVSRYSRCAPHVIDPHHHLWDLGAQQIPLAPGASPGPAAGRRRQTNCQGLPAERLLSGCPQPERCQIACTSRPDGIHRIQSARQNGCKGSPISMASRTGSSRVQRWIHRTSSKSSKVTPATRTFAEFAMPSIGIPIPPRPTSNRPDLIRTDAWRRGFGLLRRFGLSFDLQLYPAQMADAAALAHAYPDVLIILNHAGMPVDRDEEGIRLWRRGMQQLAAAANVVVKISGLGNRRSRTGQWKAFDPLSCKRSRHSAFPAACSRATFPSTNSSATLTRSTRLFTKSRPPLASRNVGCSFTITPHVTTGFWMLRNELAESSSELRTFVFMKYATRLNSFASRPEKCWGKAKL